ncbi:MAG TPA: RNA polymerase sigma factor [Marmoricola sp.]|nr:RNA polymerase sigma factor [Marmoricola sp.]
MVPDHRATFEQLYDDHIRAVHAYAVRRLGPSIADDIVAETFAAAWRRIAEAPASEAQLVWLLGIARGYVKNARRGERRRSALLERIGAQPALVQPEPELGLDPALQTALSELGDIDRELLCLIAWERLDAEAARRVLGLTAVGLRVRLHRARKKVQAHLVDSPDLPNFGEPSVESTRKGDSL